MSQSLLFLFISQLWLIAYYFTDNPATTLIGCVWLLAGVFIFHIESKIEKRKLEQLDQANKGFEEFLTKLDKKE